MPNSQNLIPHIATLVDAARSIVFTARRNNQLQNLTIKTVRKQVEHDFALPQGALDPDEIKLSIRKAINDAVLEDLPKYSEQKQEQETGTSKKGSSSESASNLKKVRALKWEANAKEGTGVKKETLPKCMGATEAAPTKAVSKEVAPKKETIPQIAPKKAAKKKGEAASKKEPTSKQDAIPKREAATKQETAPKSGSYTSKQESPASRQEISQFKPESSIPKGKVVRKQQDTAPTSVVSAPKSGSVAKPGGSHVSEAREKSSAPKVKRKSSGLDEDKPAKKSKQLKSREIIDSDEDSGTNDKPVPRKLAQGTTGTVNPKRKKGDNSAEKSESEMSVLIDDGRPKKKQRQSQGADEATKDAQKKSITLKEEPEEETETIKRLKTLVAACGARKQWTREFADIPEAKQQITHLRSLLADLGMKGQYSIEKAKAIKRQKALSRELADVQEFERKAGVSRAKRRGQDPKKRTIGELDTESEELEESEENEDDEGSDGDARKRAKDTASRKIKEYLAKQNNSDED